MYTLNKTTQTERNLNIENSYATEGIFKLIIKIHMVMEFLFLQLQKLSAERIGLTITKINQLLLAKL